MGLDHVKEQMRLLQETVPVAMQLDTKTIEMPPLVFEEPTGAVPAAAEFEPTVPTTRDPIATLLGVAPLGPPKVYAAPALVPTEVVERVSTPMTRADTERVVVASRWQVMLQRVPGWAVAAAVTATLTTAVLAVVS